MSNHPQDSVLSAASDISGVLGCVPLTSASVRVTSQCRARCRFCSTNAGPGDAGLRDASGNEILGWVEQLSAFGLQHLFITGGEPTLHPGIGAIIGGATDLGVGVVMSTNGMHIDSKMAGCLGSSGLKHLQISLHGTAKTHDMLVGVSGAHESVINAIRHSARHVEKVSVAMTVTSHNLCEMASVAEEALTAGAHWVALHPVMDIGRAKAGFVPKLKDFMGALGGLSDMHKKSLTVLLPPALVPSWARDGPFGLGHLCTFPDMVAIDADGTVAPCDALLGDGSWRLGDLRTRPLAGILSSERSTRWRGLREDPAGSLEGVCKRCRFIKLCCGGCRALSYRKHGHWNAPDIWCEEAFGSGIFPEEFLPGRGD